MIGKTYAIPPQPPVPENLTTFEAGNLSIGVEYRDVDPEGLLATYRDNPAHLAELLARSPEGGFTDEGVSLHVFDATDGHEYVRFDVFDDDPHYHYNHHGSEVVNNVIEFDVTAHGDMLPWALERIRTRLPEMLTEAGARTWWPDWTRRRSSRLSGAWPRLPRRRSPRRAPSDTPAPPETHGATTKVRGRRLRIRSV